MSEVNADAALEMRGISMRFPGVQALDQVSFSAAPGEVHGLMGENGAGKSTLLKVLSGVHRPQTGELLIGGHARPLGDPKLALQSGIAVIYQELHLVPEMSVADNLMLGHWPQQWGMVDRQRQMKHALEQLAELGEAINPTTPVKRLSIAQRQMVEIGKALMRQARVIAFDEPTSSLSAAETHRLMAIIQKLRAQGRVILYVSHRLDEVFQICDRVSVFRDGRHVAKFEQMTDLSREQLISAMVGRPIADVYGYRERAHGAPMLVVRDLLGPGLREPVSLTVRRGEILGLFGLVGAGRTELLRLIYGACPSTSGTVLLDDKPLARMSPMQTVRCGMALCPEDRKAQGIVPTASVADNLSMVVRRRLARWHVWRNQGRESQLTDEHIAKLKIKTRNSQVSISTLSGGNQQKVILARWMAAGSRVLLMDEPTRGIDVGARSEIYALLYRLAEEGLAILMVSSDLPEIIGVADRVLVMCEGRLVADVPRAQASPERLMSLALPTTPSPIPPTL